MLTLVVLALAGLSFAAPPAVAYERSGVLERVASTFARQEAEVRCPSSAEWLGDPIWSADTSAPRGWAYTNMIRGYIVLHPALCVGAIGVTHASIPEWQRAAGVLVLVHEAYHLRRWPGRWNEAKVECRAIRQFTAAARLLGASRELANDLLPYAFALHLRMAARFPEYRDPKCKLPVWTPPITP